MTEREEITITNDRSAHDDRLLDLARRLLDGEAIDWTKEGVAESEVRDGMKQLEKIIGRRAEPTETETAPTPQRDRTARFIGDFRLVRKLGEGGMGVVYEAEQQHPRRPVALKVIRGGAHVSADTLKLFQREAQTLARLRHSGIAALYETGATEDGLHYFAMELVRGSTLSAWVGQRPAGRMTPDELKLRLSVFKKICDAVAYAHQRGVIHRDLKPGNVLIPKAGAGASIPDPVPDIKVLDFGLARITDSDVQATTYVTEMGKVQGTLPYMSPEQVRGNPDEIDLRTDVYSLGVMLYEMVTGRLPYDLSKAQIPDAVRIICEENPKSIAATFTGTRNLDGDVVTITMKCLEKEPARRYQSAAALGEDVQRYLSNQPILARPPSTAYQFRKLVLRHKGPFAAAAGAFVLLAVFSAAMTFQAIRIAKERDRANEAAETAERVSAFMESLFNVSDPFAARDREISAREILDAGAERIDRELKGQPASQMRLMRTIGSVYDRLGKGDKAQPLLKRALELAEKLYGPESLEVADALNALGGIMGRLEGAEFNIRAHAIRSRLLPPDDPRMIRSQYLDGSARWVARLPGAETSLKRALAMIEASPAPDEQLHSWILNDLALVYADHNQDPAAAIPLLRRSLAIKERLYPEGHPDRGVARMNLGEYLMQVGEFDEARRLLSTALTSFETGLGPQHSLVANTLLDLGELERKDGRLDRARPLLERALAIYDKEITQAGSVAGAANSLNYVVALRALGLLDEAEARWSEAAEHLGLARQHYLQGEGVRDPSADYARVLRRAGRIAEAAQVEASVHANPRSQRSNDEARPR